MEHAIIKDTVGNPEKVAVLVRRFCKANNILAKVKYRKDSLFITLSVFCKASVEMIRKYCSSFLMSNHGDGTNGLFVKNVFIIDGD